MNELRARAERLAREQDEVNQRLRFIERIGDDTYEDGAVISFDKTHDSNGFTYTYIALKTPAGWYVTGAGAGGVAHPWERIVEFMQNRSTVEHVWLVTDYICVTDGDES